MSYVPVIVKIISLNCFLLRMYCPSCNELYSCVCEAYFSKLFCIEQNGISELDHLFVSVSVGLIPRLRLTRM